MFKPAEVASVVFGDEAVEVSVSERSNFGLAIGKGGATIEKARLLVRRFFGRDIAEIEILGEKA